jgi:hypothetical protein
LFASFSSDCEQTSGEKSGKTILISSLTETSEFYRFIAKPLKLLIAFYDSLQCFNLISLKRGLKRGIRRTAMLSDIYQTGQKCFASVLWNFAIFKFASYFKRFFI